MIKIALSGWMLSGKTTVANYLDDHYDFECYSFADELKGNLASVGIDPDRLYSAKDETVRRLMQVYGEAIREQDMDYWVDIVLDSISVLETMGGEAVVIDDLRFPNEFDKLKDSGFITVRVVNDSLAQVNFDISETALNDYALDGKFDYTICGRDGDVRHLFEQVDDIMGELL